MVSQAFLILIETYSSLIGWIYILIFSHFQKLSSWTIKEPWNLRHSTLCSCLSDGICRNILQQRTFLPSWSAVSNPLSMFSDFAHQSVGILADPFLSSSRMFSLHYAQVPVCNSSRYVEFIKRDKSSFNFHDITGPSYSMFRKSHFRGMREFIRCQIGYFWVYRHCFQPRLFQGTAMSFLLSKYKTYSTTVTRRASAFSSVIWNFAILSSGLTQPETSL